MDDFDYDPFSNSAAYVKLTDCGSTMHVVLSTRTPPTEPRIERINEDMYYVPSTAEIRFYEHPEGEPTKADNIRSIKRAFNKLKKLINCNFDSVDKVRFFTLTYAENMQNNSRISDDWRQFVKRCRRRYGHFRYIYVKEHQGRGAWHLHGFFFFDDVAPYMDNAELRAMWGQGWVHIRAIKDGINNEGNYLCAYLTDDEETHKKGARLLNYEAGIRLYNCSRDIIRPVETVITWEEYAREYLGRSDDLLSSRESCISIGGAGTVHYRYQIFNNKRGV